VFDLHSLPEKFRGAFRLTQEMMYSDISEFRADLEAMYLPGSKTQIIGCGAPCRWIMDLYAVVGQHLGLDLEKILEEKRQ